MWGCERCQMIALATRDQSQGTPSHRRPHTCPMSPSFRTGMPLMPVTQLVPVVCGQPVHIALAGGNQ